MIGDICKIDGCDKIITMRSLVCSSCKFRKKRYGSYYYQSPPPPTVEERLFSKVNKTDTCWLWKGCTRRGSNS